ncbi:MAG: hypothetical protein H6719_12115 [Sandaracinaceae bacterium]|nr:hypothetical protein [Sandaracinaceae bacterium]
MGRTMPPPVPPAASPRRVPEKSGPVPKMPPRPPTGRLPAPPPMPREARAPHLRVLPPPPPTSSIPPAPRVMPPKRETLRAAPPPPPSAPPPRAEIRRSSAPPPALLPMAKLPPKYVPPVPDEEEDGDTLVEGLEEDSFDANLMSVDPGPASVLHPLHSVAERSAKALEAIVEDVVERVDEAMMSLAEQRVVRPLYAIGGAVAVRAMIVPAIVIFCLGVAFGSPSDDIRKSFPKSAPELVVAASAPAVVALPEPPAPVLAAPEPEPQPAVAAETETAAAPAAAPRRAVNRRAAARRRARAAQRARARRRARTHRRR